jgi:hypothetical protein
LGNSNLGIGACDSPNDPRFKSMVNDTNNEIDWIWINDMTLDLRMVMVKYDCNN